MTDRTIAIHYHRPPDRTDIFEQLLVHSTAEYVVTYLESAPDRKSSRVDDEVILEPGSPIVWFTYPGRWYDIGRFHRADGTFTGFYANILTPVEMNGDRWATTDLFLDVWLSATGATTILDQPEFLAAVDAGWISAATAATAREHAETLAIAARQGLWPHPEVAEWTLEKVRKRVGNQRERPR